ncbi:MAG: PAS domain S-box protein [Woeseiaceae bacterium]
MGNIHLLDEKDFKDILDGMVDGVLTINQKGIILTFNKTAETIFGYDKKEVIGQNVSILMPDPDSSAHDSYLNNHITTGEDHIIGIGRDVTALRKNGKTFPMRLSVIEYPAKLDDDRWFIGSCQDISLQKQQEEQLNRSLKMEAVGKLTSGIAHDYNNALGIILGYSELLEEKLKSNPDLMTYVNRIIKTTKQAANLTSQLLSITRKRSDSNEETQINDVLANDEPMLAKTLTPRIKLIIDMAKDLWPCFIEKGCLEDSIINLSINAMHAMPEGGELNITTSNIQVASVDAQVLNITPGDYIKLSIVDTGIGMSQDVVAQIFDPFYSTKGEKGTGLGLSQVFNFVNKSKGTIRVYSELGHGTRFSIFLPRFVQHSAKTKGDNLDTKVEDKLNGTASILIVDDEDDMRKLTSEILSSHGYKTFPVSNAAEALALLHEESIDLVLSDVIMPDIDGFELAHIINHTYPNMKIQLCSGFEKPKGKSVTNKELLKKLLGKPFSSNKLLTRVQEELAS